MAPIAALAAVLLMLLASTVGTEGGATPRVDPTAIDEISDDVDVAPRGYVRPTTLATAAAWDVSALERSSASRRAPRWYVVAYTSGQGVHLRRRPLRSDRLQLLPEGALLVEISVSIDTSWKHVWVAPDGPGGWVPSENVAEAP